MSASIRASGTLTTLYDRCGDHPLCGPNDIVFDHDGGFYFTDFGKNRLRDRDHAGLYYGRADGSMIVEVAYPLTTANGVGLSPDDSVVYVAETETARLWAFDLEAPGRARKHPYPSPHGGRLVCGLPGYQRFDSLALDAEGNICVATLVTGCITVVAPIRRGAAAGDGAGRDGDQHLLRRRRHEDGLRYAVRHGAPRKSALAAGRVEAGLFVMAGS